MSITITAERQVNSFQTDEGLDVTVVLDAGTEPARQLNHGKLDPLLYSNAVLSKIDEDRANATSTSPIDNLVVVQAGSAINFLISAGPGAPAGYGYNVWMAVDAMQSPLQRQLIVDSTAAIVDLAKAEVIGNYYVFYHSADDYDDYVACLRYSDLMAEADSRKTTIDRNDRHRTLRISTWPILGWRNDKLHASAGDPHAAGDAGALTVGDYTQIKQNDPRTGSNGSLLITLYVVDREDLSSRGGGLVTTTDHSDD